MSVNITPNIQKILDTSSQMDSVVSVSVDVVPDNLISQIPAEESVFFDYVIKTEDVNNVEVGFVVPTKIIDENTYSRLAINDLISCSCIRSEGASGSPLCVDNKFFNAGKTTYYIRPGDEYLVRLKWCEPKVLTPTPIQQQLIDVLEKLPNVEEVHLEEILDEGIQSSSNSNNLVMVACTATLNGNTGTLHFALPDSVHSNTEIFTYVENDLINLLSQ